MKQLLSLILLIALHTLPAFAEQDKEMDDAILTDTIAKSSLSRQQFDSIRIEELMVQLQEMKLKEIVLENKLHHGKVSAQADSLKKARQRSQIDSLRAITTGTPVVIESDTLFFLYTRRGGMMPSDRAEKTKEMMLSLSKKLTMKPDSVYIFESDYVTDIMSADKVIISITDQDGLWQNTTRQNLAEQYLPLISNKIEELHKKYGLQQKIEDGLLAAFIIIIQIVLIYFTNRLFKLLRIRIRRLAHSKLKSISIKDYEFLNSQKQERILAFISNIFKYIILIIQLMISLSILFSIFPETEKYVYLLLFYLWNPAKDILSSIVRFIPDIFKIALIYLFFKYIIRGLKYIAGEVAAEKLKISGFYSDWAFPTYYILRFLLYSFMLIMIWPLLPSSGSPIFQGVSVFIGLIISLGSTSVIGNLMAGLVITYMRPFRIGDQIKLNETVGNVIEKTPFVTRIRTSKNEIITIPNSFILSSQTVNYSTSAREYGIIIHTDVTVGYEIPNDQVRELLIEAALATEGIQATPAPFVLIKELPDFYCSYQINGYTQQDKSMPRVYSELHRNILEKFNTAGIELLSPHFYAQRDGNDVMIPPTRKTNNSDKS